jgi:pimeloyl-ACP methyl ester carboxylesterase
MRDRKPGAEFWYGRAMSLSSAVEAWRARGRVVRVRGLEVFCVDEGSADEVLVLLHGFPTSSHDWSRVWEALTARLRVITFDFPGYGLSAKPEDYGYSLFEQADVVEIVLRERGVERAHLCAHDMGTSVATELLARREQQLLHFEIDRLILMNGSVHAELTHLTPAQKLLRRSIIGPLFARVANATTFRLQMRRILGRKQALSDDDLNDQFALVRHAEGNLRLPALMQYYDERLRFRRRWIGALERFDRPALILWGRLDPVAVPAIAEALAREIPGARLVWMDDLGHYPQLEDPRRVAEEIAGFLG